MTKRRSPYKKLEPKAQAFRDNHPSWMDTSMMNLMHVDCDKNGVHTLSVVQAADQPPRVVAKYIETESGVEELYIFPDAVEKTLKTFMTDIEIGGLALRLARFRKENPDAEAVTAKVNVTKKCEHQGEIVTIDIPMYWDDEIDPCRIPIDRL